MIPMGVQYYSLVEQNNILLIYHGLINLIRSLSNGWAQHLIHSVDPHSNPNQIKPINSEKRWEKQEHTFHNSQTLTLAAVDSTSLSP